MRRTGRGVSSTPTPATNPRHADDDGIHDHRPRPRRRGRARDRRRFVRCGADRRRTGRRPHPHRHRVVDRPDDDRQRRVLPASAANAEDRLQFYASTFPLVEVDATYYALPSPPTAELWVERTPPDFTFDIKAHALMTGQGTETKRLPKTIRTALPEPAAAKSRIYAKDLPPEILDAVWDAFRDGLEPLREAGQLGSILLQYPRWFFPSSENRAAIEDAVERLDGMTSAVEFRNGSWLNEKNAERTLRFLTDRDIAFVMVDEPQGFKSSVPPVTAVTSEARPRPLPRPQRRDVGGEGHHARPSGSATSTTATSSPEWAPRIRDVARSPRRPTSS